MATSSPARFTINSNNAVDTLHQIRTVTNNLLGISLEYTNNMMENIHKRKFTWFGTLEAPKDTILIKQIIGKNGLHLKTFTNKCNVDLIWHDRATNTFMVWGNKICIISALHFIKRQIHRFTMKQREELEEMEGMTVNMTSLDMARNISRSREEEDAVMEEPDRKRMKCDA
jgi:hypothetical protein